MTEVFKKGMKVKLVNPEAMGIWHELYPQGSIHTLTEVHDDEDRYIAFLSLAEGDSDPMPFIVSKYDLEQGYIEIVG